MRELGLEPLSLVGVSAPNVGLANELRLLPDVVRRSPEFGWSKVALCTMDALEDLRDVGRWLVALEERRLLVAGRRKGEPSSCGALRRKEAELAPVMRILATLLPSKPAKEALRLRRLRSSLNHSRNDENKLPRVRVSFAVPATELVEEGLEA
jgi:hypothetical protein